MARLAGLRAKHFSKKSARGFAWADGVLYRVDRAWGVFWVGACSGCFGGGMNARVMSNIVVICSGIVRVSLCICA